MNFLAATLAATAVRRPLLLIGAALILLATSLFVLRTHQTFDSEILNLLPAGHPAVEGLKIYNSRFNTARELAFYIESGDDAVFPTFVNALRDQPWVLRVLDGPPTQSPAGRSSLPDLIAPLILGQDETAFSGTLEKLDPARINARVAGLVARTSSGSPLARLELENDPLGIVAPVAASLSEKLAIEDAFNMEAGESRIVPVVTNQSDLGSDSCSAMMSDVHAFVASFRANYGKSPPEILVTGRSAYVDEIEQSMKRDIATTSLVSLVAVTMLFWFAFRSLLPLLGSVLILALTCVCSLAAGSLVFDKLNVVAMGFCSILVGLGDDFSLLLYQRYLAARALGSGREAAIRESTAVAAPGILWVSLATGLGFAALAFSGSAGFMQLGILIAMGVVAGAIGMICLMPLFEQNGNAGMRAEPGRGLGRLLVSPPVFRLSTTLLIVLAVLSIAPWRPLGFDTSTHSLEPANIPAAKALARIMEKFPSTFDPVMVVVRGPVDVSSLRALDSLFSALRDRGVIASFSSPSPLVTDPENVARNISRTNTLEIDGIIEAIRRAESRSRLQPGTMDPAIQLVRALLSAEPVQTRLPADSPWWFVLDRSISPANGDVIYYLRLSDGSSGARREIIDSVKRTVPSALVTGWSQMLHELVPWATQQLATFGTLVLTVIVVVLVAVYRRFDLLLLHLATLVLALGGTIATLKLTGQQINLLNVLAFPLIVAVGVDYGVHLILATREEGVPAANLAMVTKPVLISGLTTMTGFGALTLAANPALSGLGFVCASGVGWCLFASLCFLAPLALKVAGCPAEAPTLRSSE